MRTGRATSGQEADTVQFSVVMPTYQRGRHIERSVRSVLEQTFDDFELIIVDDHSDPPLAETAPDLLQHPKVVYRYLEENRGVCAARNEGIRLARGEYVAFLDDDDGFRPEKLAAVSAALAEAPADVLYHRMTIHFVREGFWYENEPFPAPFTFRDLLVKNLLGSPSMVVARRSSLERAGGFDEGLIALEDYDLWLRLCRDGASFRFLNRSLTDYFRHTDRGSRSLSIENDVRGWEQVHTKFAAEYSDFSETEWRDHLQKIDTYRAFRSLLGYRRGPAAALFLRAFGRRPGRGGLGLLLAAGASLLSPALTLRLQAMLKRSAWARAIYLPARVRERSSGGF